MNEESFEEHCSSRCIGASCPLFIQRLTPVGAAAAKAAVLEGKWRWVLRRVKFDSPRTNVLFHFTYRFQVTAFLIFPLLCCRGKLSVLG